MHSRTEENERLHPEIEAALVPEHHLSCQSARAALAIQPAQVQAYWWLALTLKGRLPDFEFQAMQRLTNRREIRDRSSSSDWRATRPVDLLEIRYEDLVADLEAHARRMIRFLNLEWDTACLHFDKTRRAVGTASLVQVREPIHSHSIGRWKNYESHLQPLLSARQRLGVALIDGG